MKTIIIDTEEITDRALTAAVPPVGVDSVTVTRSTGRRDAAEGDTYRAFRNPARFTPRYRIELVVDDSAVATVFDSVSFAYDAGFFSDAEMWVDAPALALTA